jgi:hypothetical protein
MNIYIQIIKDLSQQNKYLNWYVGIVENAQKRAKTRKEAKEILECCEGHHILPKSFELGGEKDKLNLVYLTAREHFILHLLLLKFLKEFYHRSKMAAPVLRMRYKCTNSRTYEIARKLASENSPSKTEEFQNKKRKTSIEIYGVSNHNQLEVVCPHCEVSGKKGGMMLSHFDYCKENPSRNVEILKCPYCDKEGLKNNMLQYHFDNCKQNPNRIEKEKIIYECPHCGKQGGNASAMKQNHFDNCLKNPNTTRELLKCNFCGIESYNLLSMKLHHFDNCKLNPSYKPKIKPTITCPHCAKEGTSKPDMLRWHFDNCRNKK